MTVLRLHFRFVVAISFLGVDVVFTKFIVLHSVYRLYSGGFESVLPRFYTTSFCMCDYFLFLFRRKKGMELRWMCNRRDCNYVSILMDHIYYMLLVRVRQKWVLLCEFPVQRHILVCGWNGKGVSAKWFFDWDWNIVPLAVDDFSFELLTN